MQLLFDQNLSGILAQELADLFPNSKHVKDYNMQKASDTQIWEFAKENDFVIISKDSDFISRSILKSYPPKVICLKIGNQSVEATGHIIRKNYPEIIDFYNNPDESCFIITN